MFYRSTGCRRSVSVSVSCLLFVFLTPFKEGYLDQATVLLRHAVDIGESWFEKDPAHEKLALWRNKLAKSYAQQARPTESTGYRSRLHFIANVLAG